MNLGDYKDSYLELFTGVAGIFQLPTVPLVYWWGCCSPSLLLLSAADFCSVSGACQTPLGFISSQNQQKEICSPFPKMEQLPPYWQVKAGHEKVQCGISTMGLHDQVAGGKGFSLQHLWKTKSASCPRTALQKKSNLVFSSLEFILELTLFLWGKC